MAFPSDDLGGWAGSLSVSQAACHANPGCQRLERSTSQLLASARSRSDGYLRPAYPLLLGRLPLAGWTQTEEARCKSHLLVGRTESELVATRLSAGSHGIKGKLEALARYIQAREVDR